MRGYFITFEGGEGSGKSTHAAMLAERLKERGIEVVLTREPGGSTGAEIIRHVLLSGAAKPLGPETEAILFAAARDDHVKAMIAPALEAGKCVVCDRFMDSTRVYQGVLGHVDPRLIRSLERVTVGQIVPNLTFIIDIPVHIGLARAARRRGGSQSDRFESETQKFHEALRQAYIALAQAEPDRCVLIDGRNTREMVAEEIWKTLVERLRPKPVREPERVAP